MLIDLRNVEKGHFSAVVNDNINGIQLNKVSEYHEPDTSGKLKDGESCDKLIEIVFSTPAQIRAVVNQLVWLETEMERQKAAPPKPKFLRETCF